MKREIHQNGWVSPELVIAPLRAQDAAEAIAQLGALLQAGGFVRDTFVQSAIEREKTFATGLPTAEVQVAIPHTDIEHVVRQAIAVGVLENPVTFGEMGNPERAVQARIVCVLAVAQSEELVRVLQKLVNMFQSPGLLRQLVDLRDRTQIAEIFNRHLSEK